MMQNFMPGTLSQRPVKSHQATLPPQMPPRIETRIRMRYKSFHIEHIS